MRRHQIACSALLALVLGACGKNKDNTELVVTVWSDLAVPTELDALRIRVMGKEQTVDHPFRLSGDGQPGTYQIPVQLALVPAGAKDLPISVSAIGSFQSTDMVSQEAILSFIPGQAHELALFLAKSCKNVSCVDHPGYTCEKGACTRLVATETSALPAYTPGEAPESPDAAAVGAGGAAIGTGGAIGSGGMKSTGGASGSGGMKSMGGLIGAGGAGGVGGGKNILDLVPTDNAVSGWTVDRASNRNGSAQPMTATSKAAAEGLIDGAAEVFFTPPYTPLEFAWQNYVNSTMAAAPDGARVSLYVFRMPSAEQATGLYAALLKSAEYSRKAGSPDDWGPTSPRLGAESRIQDTGSRWWINLHQDVFYVEVTLDPSAGPAPDYVPGNAVMKAEAIRFAQTVANAIAAAP